MDKQNLVERIAKNGCLRARVNANCCECCYDELMSGASRKQLENGIAYHCQFFAVRPISKPTNLN